jgi:hypothetical protein
MTHPLVQLLEALSRAQQAASSAAVAESQRGAEPPGRRRAAPERPDEANPPRGRRGTAKADHGTAGGATGPELTPFDQGRLIAKLFEESQRINWALFRAFVQPHLTAQMAVLQRAHAGRPSNGNGRAAPPQAENELFDMLARLQLLVLQNPMAAQAVFSSLVAEGRHFAGTSAGAQWARALAESDLVRKGRLVWEATTLNVLEERQGAVLPTTYLEVLRKAVMTKDFESLLSRLRQGIAGDQK